LKVPKRAARQCEKDRELHHCKGNAGCNLTQNLVPHAMLHMESANCPQCWSHLATPKSYLSPFNKLPKDNGAPHANSVKLGRTRLWYFIGAVSQRVICYPLKGVDKSKHISFNNKVISGRPWSFGTSRTVLAHKSFKFELYKTMAAILCGFWKQIWNIS